MRDPYKEIISNIKSTETLRANRETLNQKTGKYDEKLLEERKEKFDRPMLIDKPYLEHLFAEQNGCDYWLGTHGIFEPINLMDVFHPEGWYPWAPSVDRLEADGIYEEGNVCITFRFINFGRCRYGGDFVKVMEKWVTMCDGKSNPTSVISSLL